MAKNLLIPSIEERLGGFLEVRRRKVLEHGLANDKRVRPTVTVTREYGCEGYPVALKLQTLLEERSGRPWVVMDRALLETVAADQHLSVEILREFGARNSFLDEIFATFSTHWKGDKEHYRLLCRQIVALAQEGDVILVGRGAAILTQKTPNSFHFRMVAPIDFKVESITRRMGLRKEEAHDLIQTKQQQRDAFLKDFLGRDVADPTLYHLIFNNARCPVDQIAGVIADVVMPAGDSC